MNTLLKINWSEVVIVLGTSGLAALTLLLIFNALLVLFGWSKHPAARLDARVKRASGCEVQSQKSDAGVPSRRRTLRRAYADRPRLVWPADERLEPTNAWSY